MSLLRGFLVAVFGALVGAVVGGALTYALLADVEADAFTWLALGLALVFPGMLVGAVAAALLCRKLFPGRFGYGIGASIVLGISAVLVVLVGGPLAAELYPTGDPPRDLLAGELCREPGIRFVATDAQLVSVCFTLTPDRSKWVEIGWRFDSTSGCPGGSRPGWNGASYYDWGNTLTGPGRITEPDFSATIRGARASGELKDPSLCAGKTFSWSAREVVR
jgi:uncharacterized membrane protein YeaQ/YmgE (transglycosylase-associated protein family)